MWSDNLFGGPDLLLQIFIVSNKTNLTNFVLKLWFLFCQCKTQTADSLRSWRYCVGARLKFWRRSRVPKKGSRDEAVERGFAARDRSGVKSHSTILQRLRRQISLDYYTIPPATQANCGPGVNCWLSVKWRLQTESKTQAGVKCRPSINCSRGRV